MCRLLILKVLIKNLAQPCQAFLEFFFSFLKNFDVHLCTTEFLIEFFIIKKFQSFNNKDTFHILIILIII